MGRSAEVASYLQCLSDQDYLRFDWIMERLARGQSRQRSVTKGGRAHAPGEFDAILAV